MDDAIESYPLQEMGDWLASGPSQLMGERRNRFFCGTTNFDVMGIKGRHKLWLWDHINVTLTNRPFPSITNCDVIGIKGRHKLWLRDRLVNIIIGS